MSYVQISLVNQLVNQPLPGGLHEDGRAIRKANYALVLCFMVLCPSPRRCASHHQCFSPPWCMGSSRGLEVAEPQREAVRESSCSPLLPLRFYLFIHLFCLEQNIGMLLSRGLLFVHWCWGKNREFVFLECLKRRFVPGIPPEFQRLPQRKGMAWWPYSQWE